jgi:hypothetical protein
VGALLVRLTGALAGLCAIGHGVVRWVFWKESARL